MDAEDLDAVNGGDKWSLAPLNQSYATSRDRADFTTSRTPTPSLASMSINASVLNKIDAAAQEIADSGLRDPKHLCRFCLLKAL